MYSIKQNMLFCERSMAFSYYGCCYFRNIFRRREEPLGKPPSGSAVKSPPANAGGAVVPESREIHWRGNGNRSGYPLPGIHG